MRTQSDSKGMTKRKLEQINELHENALTRGQIQHRIADILEGYSYDTDKVGSDSTHYTVRHRFAEVHLSFDAYKETITHIRFAVYEFSLSDLFPLTMRQRDAKSVHERELDEAEYDSMKQIIVALLKGDYKISPRSKKLTIYARDYILPGIEPHSRNNELELERIRQAGAFGDIEHSAGSKPKLPDNWLRQFQQSDTATKLLILFVLGAMMFIMIFAFVSVIENPQDYTS